MKLHQVLIALVATGGIGIAAAQEAPLYMKTTFEAPKTRADVQAGIDAARAAGMLYIGEGVYRPAEIVGMPLTKAQVRAQTQEARRLGLLSGGEATVVITPAQLEQIRAAGQRATDPLVARSR